MSRVVKDIRAYVEAQKRAMRGVVTDSLSELTGRIIDRTPVLTGRLKGNWQATLNSPANSSLLTTDPDGSFTKSAAAMRARGAPGNVFYFVNNADYAHFIEFGGSKKAPAGMLEVSLVKFDAMLTRAIAKNRV